MAIYLGGETAAAKANLDELTPRVHGNNETHAVYTVDHTDEQCSISRLLPDTGVERFIRLRSLKTHDPWHLVLHEHWSTPADRRTSRLASERAGAAST